MDLLVVVSDAKVPKWLRERATHVIKTQDHGMGAELVAHVRAHIPRVVGVVGSSATAQALQKAGFAVTFFSDVAETTAATAATENVVSLEGVETVSLLEDGEPMEVADDLLQLVGDTPLVRLDRMAKEVRPHVIAKLEYFNPGGSVKDRPAVTMIEEAEREGLLKPGGTIIEPTSGNTGVGLAIVAARKKYKCIFVVPDKVAQEKINLLRAYGAEVVVCPTTVAPEHPESYYSVSDRLAAEISNAYKPNQYSNPANPLSHYRSTGPEIWRQTKGRITHFVAGAGTAGTIVGVGRYLKEQNPNVQVIAADPVGSVYSGGSGRPYLVEGVGEDFWPENYDASVIDRVIAVSDRDSFLTARRLTTEEGIFTGGSSGMAVHAALTLSEELTHTDVVVVLIPDSGRGYLSKLYSDAWMADYGFSKSKGATAADVLERKTSGVPQFVHVHPHETVREVIAIMREFEVSQVIVVKAEPPFVLGEVAGSVAEEALLQQAFQDPGVLERAVGELMDSVPQTVGAGENVASVINRLEKVQMLLVVDSGLPLGILTRSDVLEYLTSSNRT